MHTTAYGRCVAIVAHHRAGTQVFQRALADTPDFHNCGEVFSPEGSFTPYLRSHPIDALRYLGGTFGGHRAVFRHFIRWLARRSPKPHFIIDLKHTTMRRLGGGIGGLSTPPPLLRWLQERDIRIVLMRRDAHRQAISEQYAVMTGLWGGGETKPVIELDPALVRQRAAMIDADCRMIDGWLDGYPRKILLRYEQLFDGDGLSPEALGEMSSLMGRPITAAPGLPMQRVLDDPRRLIINYDAL